ncbi:MAG: hypothetical protein N0A00_08150 [Candidatus Bathyarchaeota archaeon]|nr:hypothetical protein [Candidatus Bathyarchaeota archaeon]
MKHERQTRIRKRKRRDLHPKRRRPAGAIIPILKSLFVNPVSIVRGIGLAPVVATKTRMVQSYKAVSHNTDKW